MWLYDWNDKKGRWIVFYYTPEGFIRIESNWRDKEDAAKRCHYLNGGN